MKSDLPFATYPENGRKLLGRPKFSVESVIGYPLSVEYAPGGKSIFGAGLKRFCRGIINTTTT